MIIQVKRVKEKCRKAFYIVPKYCQEPTFPQTAHGFKKRFPPT